jgi:exodeoxyribonuclease VII small subunit
MSDKNEKTIKQLLDELDEYMSAFDASDLDVDAALKAYEKADTVITELQNRIKAAELKINDIKSSTR